MPSGDRNRVWFPEVIAALRDKWRSDLPVPDVVALRNELQEVLSTLRRLRGVVPPKIRCPSCGVVGSPVEPVISVRAMLMAAHRYGIASSDECDAIATEWERYRKAHKLDLTGKRVESRIEMAMDRQGFRSDASRPNTAMQRTRDKIGPDGNPRSRAADRRRSD
jgi:hypothetical protein